MNADGFGMASERIQRQMDHLLDEAEAAINEGSWTLSLLDESLAISSDLGMRPLMERVLSRREILKA